ncbi:GspH/FimT family protein [Kangiella marina]|uniref:Type II secretion system protein H n=1 Tax=Kangiella marina TaxID=1079178 RepID=A0ABP8IQR3_9GAMM
MMNRKVKAFTIIELMTTVAIVAVMAAIATPSLRNMILNNRLAAFSNDMISSVSAARNEAISTRQSVAVEPNGGDWSDGWLVFVDSNANGSYDNGEEKLKSVDAYPESLSVNSAPGSNLTFNSKGTMENLGGWGTLKMCDDRGAGRSINVAGAGIVSVTKIDVGGC